ncbi:hypothetical protein [Mesoterricola sediminis]|uniref:Uncharacterized protein n=1 Tax=Mesoterricola sediminis TaxID=2927980 RepID=A0AA48GSV1_9BACT|nr:hypothetical protein [Mesoterricola sediminis]BDU78641.1 hypothetical protein METESE_35990 [Mesoterricola sediminis]
MLPLVLALALVPDASAAPSPGPTPPPVKGLIKPLAQGAGVADYVRWSLKEVGQAVVVVEGEAGLPLPTLAAGIKVFDGNLKLFRPRLPLPSEIPAPAWMDANTVMAGGNVVQKTYPIGWGY